MWVLTYLLQDVGLLQKFSPKEMDALHYFRIVLFWLILILLYWAIGLRLLVACRLDHQPSQSEDSRCEPK